MARIHGRNGIVYMGIASGGTATAIPFLSTWSISFQTDKADVTAFGDTNKVYVAGLPDASGDFSGFWDDATSQTYVAATDGLARNMYLYPNVTADPNTYFFGTVLPDFAMDGAVGGAITTKTSWSAASKVQRYTPFSGLNT